MYRWLTPLAPFVQLHKIAYPTTLGIVVGLEAFFYLNSMSLIED